MLLPGQGINLDHKKGGNMEFYIIPKKVTYKKGPLTIYDIKYLTQKKQPYFFDRNTMKFFGQTMRSFHVYKQKDGKYLIRAAGNHGVITERLFNPMTDDLEHVSREEKRVDCNLCGQSLSSCKC